MGQRLICKPPNYKATKKYFAQHSRHIQQKLRTNEISSN